ncbi:MAG: TIGR03618 family F420-dependent PPOX class oxidoreductase [Dehalococcoidia bacterium]|nr:TIGR03618 family F420-dependent PPOX class oxidoreductase [Dehalococcoidia bacterium]
MATERRRGRSATPEERREFLESNRLAIVGLERRSGSPALTPVYYVLDGDDLLMSTTNTRQKYRSIKANPRVSVCVMSEEFPFIYLTIYGRAVVEESVEAATDLWMSIMGVMYGQKPGEEQRPEVEEIVRSQGRVVVRFTPESYAG